MKRNTIVTLLLGIMLAALSLTGCGGNALDSDKETVTAAGKEKASNKVKIETTFYAISEFAMAVGGDKVEISTIIPAGMEPHDFEPKAMDIARMSEANLFAYNGIGMESWVDKALDSAANSSMVVVDTSKGAELIQNSDTASINEHGKYDPHLWLSLTGAQKQAENIRDALIKLDGANKDYYVANCKVFTGKLQALLSEYSGKFSGVKEKNFVTGHAAFAYLCKDFGLRQNSVENVFAEGEPSARRLKELVDYCRANKIKTIFMENMASPRISETLAREVGANVVKIRTLESKEDNTDYISAMEYNLKNIFDSLK